MPRSVTACDDSTVYLLEMALRQVSTRHPYKQTGKAQPTVRKNEYEPEPLPAENSQEE